MLQFLSEVSHSEQKERATFTKDKAALNVILHNCTKPRHCSRYMGIVSSQTFLKSASYREIFRIPLLRLVI